MLNIALISGRAPDSASVSYGPAPPDTSAETALFAAIASPFVS
jgi:hypothetical protein